jgi:hypothetical protein
MFTSVSFVLGAISALIVAFVHLKIADWTDYWLFGTTYFLVLPLGGAFLGFAGALGVSLANVIREEAPLSNGFVGMAIGLFTWYLSYKLLANRVGFDNIWDGIFYLIDHADTTIMWKHEHHPEHVALGNVPFLSWISAIAEPVGAIVGGLFAGVLGAPLAGANKPATS